MSENIFANDKLLNDLIPVVVDSLGCAYPEIPNKQQAILELISHEQEVFKALRESSSKAYTEVLSEFPNLEDVDLMECPGFVPAYRDFQSIKHTFKNNKIPGDFLYKLTDTYGLTEENFQKLAELEDMTYDMAGYKNAVANAKLKAKAAMLPSEQTNSIFKNIEESLAKVTKSLPASDNQYKYNYTYNEVEKEYTLPELKTKVLAVLYNDVSVNEVVCHGGISNNNDVISIVTEASNFYYESGGQQSDKGVVLLRNSNNETVELRVINVRAINECIVHMCEIPKEKINFAVATGDEVVLQVDCNHRKRNICHHTGM